MTSRSDQPDHAPSEPNLIGTVPADLLRRALKNHDAIAAALRTGINSPKLVRAIEDMRALKAEATNLGCYR